MALPARPPSLSQALWGHPALHRRGRMELRMLLTIPLLREHLPTPRPVKWERLVSQERKVKQGNNPAPTQDSPVLRRVSKV